MSYSLVTRRIALNTQLSSRKLPTSFQGESMRGRIKSLKKTVCFPSRANYIDLEIVIGAPTRKFNISGGKPDGGLKKVRVVP